MDATLLGESSSRSIALFVNSVLPRRSVHYTAPAPRGKDRGEDAHHSRVLLCFRLLVLGRSAGPAPLQRAARRRPGRAPRRARAVGAARRHHAPPPRPGAGAARPPPRPHRTLLHRTPAEQPVKSVQCERQRRPHRR